MRYRQLLRAKIENAEITDTQLYYKGSIGIDKAILKKSSIEVNEKVQVFNRENGAVFETYVLEEKYGSGNIVLYGPAARLGSVKDKIEMLAYGLYEENEIEEHKPNIISLGDKNELS